MQYSLRWKSPAGLTPRQAEEWLAAAIWCARRGLRGRAGDELPILISSAVSAAISREREAFAADVELASSALAA